MKNVNQFKRTLRRATLLALISGKISAHDSMHVAGVLLNSKRTTPDGVEVDLLEEIAKDALACMQEDGKVGANETVDSVNWDSILNFVKEFMPVIIEFINTLMALFGKTDEVPVVQ